MVLILSTIFLEKEMSMLRLIELTMEYDKQSQACQKILAVEGPMDGCGTLRRFDRTQDWIDV